MSKIEVSGVVNFPIHSTEWKNTGENGTVVKLVVVEPYDVRWRKCIGSDVHLMYEDSFVFDDKRPRPEPFDVYESYEDMVKERKMIEDWESYHFPYLHQEHEMGKDADLVSVPYLAAVVLGTVSNWTGWSEKEKRYWGAKYDDLTEEGKALYNTLQELYKGCELHILTFIDT